jgi:glycosyltransferase involved in cell wall biosynthesis
MNLSVFIRYFLKLFSLPPVRLDRGSVGAEWRGLHSLRSIDPNGLRKKFIKRTIFIWLSLFTINQQAVPVASDNRTDLIIYSYDRPLQLYALLESTEQHVIGLARIFVIMRASTGELEHAYHTVKNSFSYVEFYQQSAPYDDLKQLTLDCLSKTNQEFVVFGVDDIIVKDTIDFNECIYVLEKTQAHAFFLRLGKNLDYCYTMNCAQPLPRFKQVRNDIYSWQFSHGKYDWCYPNNLDFTLYRKKYINPIFSLVPYKTPYALESEFMAFVDMYAYGLCYQNSKIINIPLNVVQNDWPNNALNSHSTQQLLELFNQDLKIDITRFHKIPNKSAHFCQTDLLTFIPRSKKTEDIKYESEDKLFVIVTPSYNNIQWWEWNLSSLINQDYSNYYILITDDCSTDGTGQALEKYIKENKLEHKVFLTRNKERRGALHNLYYMIHSCPDNAVIVTVDGDDALYDTLVLSRLNKIYKEQEVWLTYGQFLEYPSGAPGWCTPMPDYIIKNNAFRDYEHIPSHLRTFYAWLFKCVKLEDMLDRRGDFYAMTWDYAMMLPMIEMAGERHLCLHDQIMYVYNNANTINDHKISRQLQAHIAQVIRAKERYKRLHKRLDDLNRQAAQEKADFIIFAEDIDPKIVDQFLFSIKQNVMDIASIFVLYLPTSIENSNLYMFLKEKYPDIRFLEIEQNRENFRDLLLTTYVCTSQSKYIVFARGNNNVLQPLHLSDCIKALEETQAYAFSLYLSKEQCSYPVPNRLSVHEIKPEICAWNYALANGSWSNASSLNMVLYRKQNDLVSYILNKNCWVFSSWDFEGILANLGSLDKIGLCWKHPKIISL